MKTRTKLLPLVASLLLVGCGSSGGNSASTDNVSAPTGEKKPSGKIEVAAFQGGYGIDFYQQAAKEFQTRNPGVTIEVTGDPRIWEKLRPQIVAGTPPDLMFPGWGMDHWALAEEGQLMDLGKALNSPAAEGGNPWRSTFEPSLLALGNLEGKQYVLPYYFNVMGWWYDPGVFAKNGWTPPKTYPELLTLCEKIKAKGLPPITFQGHYPYYMIDGMLLPWTMGVGGPDAIKACENLEPGAWKSPAVLQAAKMIAELRDKGFFQEGAVGMTHTASQEQFVQGKAAMIPCGTWLFSEMKKQIPPGMKMQFFLPPAVPNGKGDPTNVLIGIEPWMVPSKGKNPDGAIALFKYMTSLTKAKQFVEQKGTLMAIKGSDQVNLPEVLKVPSQVFKESKDVWALHYRNWYPALETEMENALTSMLNKELTPEQFCNRVEAEAQKTRDNKDVTKHKL